MGARAERAGAARQPIRLRGGAGAGARGACQSARGEENSPLRTAAIALQLTTDPGRPPGSDSSPTEAGGRAAGVTLPRHRRAAGGAGRGGAGGDRRRAGAESGGQRGRRAAACKRGGGC